MNLKIFLRPTIWKISLGLFLFIIFQLFDFWFGISGGLGSPFKFFALGIPFLTVPGFFSISFIIIDILFFYILATTFFYSKTGKIITILLLLTTFFLMDRSFRHIHFFEKPEQSRLEFKQRCEAIGMRWIDGIGDTLGTCQSEQLKSP